MSRIASKMPTSYTEAKAMLKGYSTKKIAHNTFVRMDDEGNQYESISIQYHNTRIVKFTPNGRISLNTNGWRTRTTADRINGALRGSGYAVYQKDYAWFLRTPDGEHTPFTDNMIVEGPKPKPAMDTYRACSIVEGFSGEEHTEDEQIEAWQHLIDTGACWSLQGWYGRTAQSLIEQGICVEAR